MRKTKSSVKRKCGGVQRYREIADILCAEVRAEKYKSVGSFPSLTNIVRRFCVSRATAARSVAVLKSRGVIATFKGVRPVVLRSAAENKIGIIAPDIAMNEFFRSIVGEIEMLAARSGYALRIADTWSVDRAERIRQIREHAAKFVTERFAGVIYAPLDGADGDVLNMHICRVFDRKHIPVVLLDCDVAHFPERSHFDVVGVNDVEAGARIARHLVSAGAKTVHFLMGRGSPATFERRQAGAEMALISAFGKCVRTSDTVLRAEANDLAALKMHLEKSRTRPDAFVCGNDILAAEFVKTLGRAGLRVPDDIMVTGFADLQKASLSTPSLTTIRQDMQEMAEVAFRRLVQRISTPGIPPCDIFLHAPLVVRESTTRKRRTIR